MLRELIEGAKTNPIWFGSIGAITAVQGWLGWEFWGSITNAPPEQAALRAVGVALVGGEVVALDMGSRAGVNGEHIRANALRAMWLALATVNLAVDVNALSRVLSHNDGDRAVVTGQGQEREAKIAALDVRIGDAAKPFGHPLLPSASYDERIASKGREIAATPESHLTVRRRLEDERGGLQAERAAALAMEGLITERDNLKVTAASTAPVVEAAEFAPLAKALTGLAHTVHAVKPTEEITPAQAREGVAISASVVMKLMLTFGIWAGLERRRRPAPERSQEPEIIEGRVLPPARPVQVLLPAPEKPLAPPKRRAQRAQHFRAPQRRR